MDNIKIENKWEYENGFYLTSSPTRIGKLLAHFEIYKMIIDLPGDVLEFGVYKGASFIRWLTFREILENNDTRSIIGFDAFGKFPDSVLKESDKLFISKFENEGGFGIAKSDLDKYIKLKGFRNFDLLEGDIIETLPKFLAENPANRIALLHIDVDVYEPTKFILEKLWERLVPGGLLVLDDYGTVEGETMAVEEFFHGKPISMKKLSYYKVPTFIKK